MKTRVATDNTRRPRTAAPPTTAVPSAVGLVDELRQSRDRQSTWGFGGLVRRIGSAVRVVALTVAVAVVLVVVPGLEAPAAHAGTKDLCSGDWSCATGGYSETSRSWADRYYYAGSHNCTRYAAHRLAVNGYPDPGHSWGAAWKWDQAAPGTHNSTPTVGAIAYWNVNLATQTPTGHVAYVEEVGDGYIVITEDNAGGVTKRRKLTPGDAYWPNKFLHIKDLTSARRGADFNGDGKTDLVVRRGSKWYVDYNRNAKVDSVWTYGNPTDVPVAADFNGDGKTDLVVRRGSKWYVDYNRNAKVDSVWTYGNPTDVPVAADFNGDGKTDLVVRRGEKWYVDYNRDRKADSVWTYGRATDIPVAADFNGDGKTDLVVRRGEKWYVDYNRDRKADSVWTYGRATDIPVG